MAKLKLSPDHLRVESFTPEPERDPRTGTVHANEFTEATCNQFTCAGTCDPAAFSCNGQNTCYGPRCPQSVYPTCIPVCHTGDIC